MYFVCVCQSLVLLVEHYNSLFSECHIRYLLKILGSGESVRLQYRSLRKLTDSQREDICGSEPIQGSSSEHDL